ncbi:hypothetical protein [Nitrospina watsonii]|uniref:Uncharacterized protein n=1 Tax=Nitrospina watsonii TaxID=1323948 RepID=A0ABN8VYC5_9BACT|nr:hypothetical protein [Nitrospina watsonii]CAI2718670.1 protein of unknown function [Nitrospina watsonii]
MSDGLKYNNKAQKWFENQGVKVIPEKDLGLDLKKDNPDFLCSKDEQEFWVEVKSIDLPERVQALGDYFDKFKSRESKITSPGRGLVTITPETTQRDIKFAVSLIDRVLSKVDLSSNENIQYHVVIPKDPVPDYNKFVRIEYQVIEEEGIGEITEYLFCVKSQLGKYSRCYLGDMLRWDAKTKIIEIGDDNEDESVVSAIDLGLFDNDGFRLSIQLMKGDGQFKFFGIAPHEAEMSRNTLIIKNRASKASSQIKSASDQTGEKPGLVVFYQENPASANDETFVSVFYGDVTCKFSVDEKEESRLFYGRNGFWGKEKNTSLSAALYFRTNERPICVYNNWAKNPLPQGLLDCKQYVLQDDGSFVIYE